MKSEAIQVIQQEIDNSSTDADGNWQVIPEHKLLIGLLYGAIKDCWCSDREVSREARLWLDDRTCKVTGGGFSFLQVRQELRLSSGTVRRIRQFVNTSRRPRDLHRFVESL